jgi:hypothetical protein
MELELIFVAHLTVRALWRRRRRRVYMTFRDIIRGRTDEIFVVKQRRLVVIIGQVCESIILVVVESANIVIGFID